jgi:hypothetical protein
MAERYMSENGGETPTVESMNGRTRRILMAVFFDPDGEAQPMGL